MVQDYKIFTDHSILGYFEFLLGEKHIFVWNKIIQFFDHLNIIPTFSFGIALVFKNMTNTNTILTVGIVFQYNTSRIVLLCLQYRTSSQGWVYLYICIYEIKYQELYVTLRWNIQIKPISTACGIAPGNMNEKYVVYS